MSNVSAGSIASRACNYVTRRRSGGSRQSCVTTAISLSRRTRSGRWTSFTISCSTGARSGSSPSSNTFTRLSPAIDARQNCLGCDVVETLEHGACELGYPKTIRVDNGPEFISKDLDLWAFTRGVTLDFSRPGRPTDNVFIGSLNGKFRAECLNANWFMSLDEARRKCEDWRRDYNEVRPHSAIGNKVPMELHRAAGNSGQPSVKAVGPALGLTPILNQSGESFRVGQISLCGDDMMRHLLYEAAQVMLTRVQKWSWLKAWAVNVARRRGVSKKLSSRSPVGWPWSCIACGSMARNSVGRERPRRPPSDRTRRTTETLEFRRRRIDVPRGTMDGTSSLWLLCRSHSAIRTRVRVCRPIPLIPCWESRTADPEEKRGPASGIAGPTVATD